MAAAASKRLTSRDGNQQKALSHQQQSRALMGNHFLRAINVVLYALCECVNSS
ncbi:hypothetical protein NQZ68_021186 [Dissostichus eleginoides]|nr:hypothetical protein NQZ68_021186 [Dissostichus eleginoides]